MPFFSHRQADNGGPSLEPVPSRPSTRRKLLSVFSRPKSPVPPAPVTPARITPARIGSGNEEQGGHSVPPQPTSRSDEPSERIEPTQGSSTEQSEANEHPIPTTESQDDVNIERSHVSEFAYHKAWSSLSEDQRQLLTGDGIRAIFDQLRDADQKHQGQSLLRKGLKVVSPYLDRLQITIDFVSPFASVNPAAGTATGLIKGVNSVWPTVPRGGKMSVSTRMLDSSYHEQIVIAICGAADKVSSQIGSFLERIPAIERCSEVVDGRGQLLDIHNVSHTSSGMAATDSLRP